MRVRQIAPIWMLQAFTALGLAFLGIFAWVFFREYFAEWRARQTEFRQIEQQIKDPHALSIAPRADGLRQVWIADLDRVDRCTTCHLGADDPAFAQAAEPFRTHGGNWLRTHRPDRFGCTACHGGQGEATTYLAAAHQPIPYWPEPMRPPELMEANCGACHRERQPRDVPWLSEGRRAIADANCVACHDIPGFHDEEIRAPRLDSVGYKVRPDWVGRWLKDPKAYLPNSRMPNFRLPPDEIEALTAFLLSQTAVAPLDSSTLDWKKADPDRGRAVFGEARCVSCHSIEGRGGTLGPELTKVGSKVRRDWLFSFLKDPFRDHPETLMVHYRFSDTQIRDLAAYLTQDLVDLDAPSSVPEVGYLDPKGVEAGRVVFVKHGCYSCHPFADMEKLGKIGPSLAKIGDRLVEKTDFADQEIAETRPNWLFVKLLTPDQVLAPSRMPTFNFSNETAAAITVALLSIQGKDLPVSRVTREAEPTPYRPQGLFGTLVERYRCLSCHQIQGFGGNLSTVPLDRIGSQLQRDYIWSYLQNPSAVRVSVEERMPHFNLTPAEATTLADYLSTVFINDEFEQLPAAETDDALRGERLYEKLGCRGCHIVGGKGGYVGPDLTDSGRRLKPGWVMAWLEKPEQWKPGTLQPDYGIQPEQARELTAYIMSLSSASRRNR